MSKLFIVPTPIGNLQDITLRALEVLRSCDIILAEDTRKTGVLLKHFDIKNSLRSHHKFNEHKTLNIIIHLILSGKNTALVTDAGTPGISDPGFLLIREAIAHNISIETLPGATAFVPAIVNSGLPCDKFVFEGFLPVKKGKQKLLENLKNESRTMVFYESPYRLLKTLKLFKETMGIERKVSVSREISKIYEETIRGTIEEVINHYSNHPPKGEIVIVLEGLNN